LLASVRDAGVQAIVVTQFLRTRATAGPLATALGIEPEVVPDTGAGHAQQVADVVLRHHAGQTVLVVGHGHTVPAIMRALGAPPAARPNENQYDLMFIISVVPGRETRVVRARYGAAAPLSGQIRSNKPRSLATRR
jgi:broad specificity phosphatase PhoE